MLISTIAKRFLISLLILLPGCATTSRPGELLQRQGDEIIACGQLIHTGAPVVLWMDPNGYDAYRVERRFVPLEDSSWDASHKAAPTLKTPNRFGLRADVLTPEELQRVHTTGWDLPLLQQKVDQFVLHYDAAGTSRQCFNILHDTRDLSVHFMLDLDGTIYQTLDLKERAWHATTSNSRSIGIEIANVGAFSADEPDPFPKWYERDGTGQTRIKAPPGSQLHPNTELKPIRNDIVIGQVQGLPRRQYDLTPQQYDSLIKLTATLCRTFPKIRCDYPRDPQGNLITHKLADEDLKNYHGLIGHYHIQLDKSDPGPALQWDRVINGARELMK